MMTHLLRYGLLADLLECLIQRVFSYNTMDVRFAFDSTKALLADPSVKKVVLIGHSQGGIIASLVLDQLYADLPIQTISKLVSIYTHSLGASSHYAVLIQSPISTQTLSTLTAFPLGNLYIWLRGLALQQPPPLVSNSQPRPLHGLLYRLSSKPPVNPKTSHSILSS